MRKSLAAGPPTLAFETWLIANARKFFQFVLDYAPASLLERFNGLYARRGKRITPQSLIKAYEAGHARIVSRLKRTAEPDRDTRVATRPDREVNRDQDCIELGQKGRC